MSHKTFVLFGVLLLGIILQTSARPKAKDSRPQSILKRLNDGESLIVRLNSVYSPGEYLYAAKEGPTTEKQYRGVYTWKDTKKFAKGRWADWKITPVYTEKGKQYVQLANVNRCDELLMAPPSETKFYYNSERRYSCTLKEKLLPCQSADWIMEANITTKNPERYSFMNARYMEYLYAASFSKDSNRRYAFTWIGEQVKEFENTEKHLFDLTEVEPNSDEEDGPN